MSGIFRAVLVAVATAAPVTSAVAQQEAKPEVVQTSVTTRDGWTIPLTYYKTADDREAPVVLMLQGEDVNRQAWTPLAKTLHAAGYAVLTCDLRKSGESSYAGRSLDRTTPGDYRAMVGIDLETIKEFVHDEHQAGRLNIRKTGIVAAGGGAPLAVAAATADWMRPPLFDAPMLSARTPRGQDVRSLVMLTPDSGVPGISVGNAVRKLVAPPAKVSLWIGVGERGRDDIKTAEAFFKQAGGKERKSAAAEDDAAPKTQVRFLRVFPGVAQKGTDLLQPQIDRQLKVSLQVVSFFNTTLKSLPDVWVDRAGRR